MTRGRLWMAVVVAALFSSAWAVSASAAEEVAKFRFAPVDKATRIADLKLTQTVQVKGGEAKDAPPQVYVTSYREKQVFSRTDKGYQIRSTALDAGSSGGAVSLDPMISALKGKTIVYTTDADGKLLSIEGLEQVAADLRKGIPPGAPESAAKRLTAEFLAAGIKDEWASSVSDYVGHPAVPNSSWVSVDQLRLMDGRVAKCYVAKKVVGTATVQGRSYLRVQTLSNSDPGELRSLLGASAEAALAGLKPFADGAKVSGESTVTVDPQTMDISQVTAKRRVEFTVKIPERGDFAVTLTEVREATEVPAKATETAPPAPTSGTKPAP